MEAIDRLKLQIEHLLQQLSVQREENSWLHTKIEQIESDNALKDEYIKALEEEIGLLNTEAKLKSVYIQG